MKWMTRSMVVEKPGQIVMREFPIPAIGPEDGLLRVELAGVCGSDPGLYRGKPSSLPIAYPLILGHEIVGRIEELPHRKDGHPPPPPGRGGKGALDSGRRV